MKRTVWLAALAGLAVNCKALAVGGLATVSVIDRDSGTQLSTYYFKGEYWVAGRPGARYAIRDPQLCRGPAAGGDLGGRDQCHLRRNRRLGTDRLRL